VTEAPVAMLTGAGSGIGRAAAVMLAREGFRLALVGRRLNRLEETAALARRESGTQTPLLLAADVGDVGAAAGAVDRVVRRLGRLDALINNAAAIVVQPLAQADEATMLEIFSANVLGPLAMIARALPIMIHRGGGRIINISSVAAVDPFPGLAIYAASKAALDSLTRSIVIEAGPSGVEAYSILPGAVETAMLRSVMSPEQLPSEMALRPEEVAAVIADCAAGRRKEDIGRPIILDPRERGRT
jgi:NADP-dependent 3-hydroxy acid dehydrogenase YdfG